MAVLIDPDDLNQGFETAVSDTVFTVPGTGADVDITSGGSEMPALAAGEFFEVRDMADAENNGLYQVVTVNSSTADYSCDKVTATSPISAASEASRFFGETGMSTEKSIHYDIYARDIYLLEQGNLSVDGATVQCVYSKIKLDWKSDNDLIPHPFPAIAITPEQFEFIDDWNPEDDGTFSIRTRKLLRSGGWSEVSETGSILLKQYASVITLGSFEDSGNDVAYYQFADDPTDTAAAIDFDFAGPVNEAVQSYLANVAGPDASTGFDFAVDDPSAGIDSITRNDGGNWYTDGFRIGGQITVRLANNTTNNGTYYIVDVENLADGAIYVVAQDESSDPGLVADTGDMTAVLDLNSRNKFRPRLRIRDGDTNGKTFDASDLPSIGITDPDGFNNRVFRFPLSNATDLKITATDGDMTSEPWSEVRLRYLAATYNREVDSATPRDFGIVIDVGTYSNSNGVSNGTTTFTSADAEYGTGEADGDYTGGELILHEGTDQGSHTISTVSLGAGTLTVTLNSALTGSESNLSFTVQRSSPLVATAEEIYEKVQFQLRQDADIDDSGVGDVITGRTADEVLTFVGDSLVVGFADTSLPSNPSGGGTGVIIEGFDSNDTNRLSFFDNGGTSRTFPFVAAGTINFNDNLVNDSGPAEYFMFFEYTEQFTNTGFGLSSSSGSTATLDSSVTDLTAELVDGDYIRLTGFATPVNNGIYVLTGTPAGGGPFTVTVRKVNGDTLVDEAAGASVSLDKNPIDSPDAIIVQDNSSMDITGTVGGPSVGFDFDYDNNVQGGRTAATDADIVIRALGEDTAAFVETFGTITRATGLTFSVVAPLERNFSNP